MSSYSCSKCSYTTKNKSHINIHLKSIKCRGAEAIEDKLFIECDICGKKFETEPYLNSHKKTCVEKKTNTVVAYANSNEMDEELKNLKNLVKSLFSSVKDLSDENQELKRRLDRFEKVKEKEDSNKRKGFVELTEEEILEKTCSVVSNKFQKFSSFENLDKKFIEKKMTNKTPDGYWNVRIMYGNSIEVGKAVGDGIKIFVKEKEKLVPYGESNIIVSTLRCNRDPAVMVIKTEQCYCKKHFDEESGKPLVEVN